MRRTQEPAHGSPDEVASAVRPRPEEIAARAFEFYERRGSVDGADLDDWLAAERQLVRERPKGRAGV
jgi:hypothetical protein